MQYTCISVDSIAILFVFEFHSSHVTNVRTEVVTHITECEYYMVNEYRKKYNAILKSKLHLEIEYKQSK